MFYPFWDYYSLDVQNHYIGRNLMLNLENLNERLWHAKRRWDYLAVEKA